MCATSAIALLVHTRFDKPSKWSSNVFHTHALLTDWWMDWWHSPCYTFLS